jgi:hypothetical protein
MQENIEAVFADYWRAPRSSKGAGAAVWGDSTGVCG